MRKVKMRKFFIIEYISYSVLTRVRLCIFTQKEGARYWNLLRLTCPGAVGRVARVLAILP